MGTRHESSRIAVTGFDVPRIVGAKDIAVVSAVPTVYDSNIVYIVPGGSEGSSSSSTGTVTLGSRFRPEKGLFPLPAASPAPLTTDGGIADGTVSSTTGLKFINWANDCFNYQGNYITPAGAGLNAAIGLSANQVVQNASTPRKYNFGALNNEFLPSTMNIRFATDSTRVIPIWVYYSSYSGTNYTDMHVMAEHEGQMKHLSSSNSTLDGMPRSQSTSGGVKRRELTFLQRRFRRMRFILPGFCYFAGMFVDTLATVKKTPNLDLFMHNGDSWNEPTGASFSSGDSPGTGFPSSSYQCLGLPEYLSFETGAAHGTYAQGGTGEENANSTSGGNASSYSGTGFSAMWSDSRINDLITKFGSQYGIQVDIGGWNDGPSLGTPYTTTYQNRVAARYSKLFAAATAAGKEIKAIMVTIQPVLWTPGDNSDRDLSTQGQVAAAAMFPDQVLGSVNIGSMWDNTGTGGQRSIFCLSQGGVYIHLNVSGNISVAGHLAQAIGAMRCSEAYLEKTRQAGMPSGGSASVVEFDAVGGGASTADSGTSVSWSHTASGVNRAVIVGVAVGAGGTQGAYTAWTRSVTYDGAAMTSLGVRNGNDGTAGFVELFGLLNPPTGTKTVVASAVRSPAYTPDSLIANSVSYTGVGSFDTATTAVGQPTPPTINVSSNTNSMVVAALAAGGAISGPNKTQRYLNNLNADTRAGNLLIEDAAGATSVTLSAASVGSSDSWSMVGVSLSP